MSRIVTILVGLLALAMPLPTQAQDSLFQYASCPVEIPEDEIEGETIDCGYLTAPANHFDDDGVAIQLAVAIIRSSSDQPAPDPVLYLQGGPGGEAISEMGSWLGSPILDTRDVILLDQRGTGYSTPLLDCVEPESDGYQDELQSLGACLHDLGSQGIDVDDYYSLQSAADVHALRQALGYDEWNLLGISYGTRLALTVLREFPDGVRSVVLDGVYPPQVDTMEDGTSNDLAGLQTLFWACAADRMCDAVFPYLESDFWTTVASMQQEPLLVPYTGESGAEVQDPVDGKIFYRTIKDSLNDTLVIPYLPAVIDSTAAGEPRLLADLLDGALPPENGSARLRQALAEPDGDARGAYWSVECSEEIPFNDPDLVLADAMTAPAAIREEVVEEVMHYYAVCVAWGVLPASGIEASAVESDVPALILSGQFDVATPAGWGWLASETLPNSWVYEIPGAGHATIDADDCPGQVIASFLDDPLSEPDAWCVAEMGPPEWVVTDLYWRR